ncbi:aldo/keto reductase [Devosia sp. Leaf420]|uniref:aldo/keto reductase n=1 Tax=Devosia sp. Leaf420 TaxID=1736374 RepID=UPI0007160F73|nr:aldo/keto reductase [Devosia sp. Leaf420]KQT47049.1 aldo/keto reductase [Devosia sp. Leaf420]
MSMTNYRTLGKSGLIVSPLALGTMTFGTDHWGADEATSRAIFDAYVEAGGNFVDTADIYSGGQSETMLGGFIRERNLRDRIVLATKFGFSREQGTPLAGGNGRKNIRTALEGSLKHLGTDYVDLYWMHVWDRTTPAEEVLAAIADAIRAGKILHYGFSNTPSWYVAKIATLAEAHGLPKPIGLQYSYSLIDRGVELDILSAANEFGLGLVPWSPLGAGLLTGKYGRDKIAKANLPPAMPDGSVDANATEGRLNGDNPFGGMLFTARNFDIVDAVRTISEETGKTMAQVALSWVAARPGVASVLIGASRPDQLVQNIASLELALSEDQLNRLEAATAIALPSPYFIFQLPRQAFFGGQSVSPWAPRRA